MKKHGFPVYGEPAIVDALCFGPHPDDIEIGMAGTLLLLMRAQMRVGLVDLTRGELGTKGDAETRLRESSAAAESLGVAFRWNLALPDGRVSDSEENRKAVVTFIRLARPRWVFANLEENLHPDHAAGAGLVRSACFLSRLPKYLPEVPFHAAEGLFHYLIHTQAAPSFLVDVSGVLEKKLDVMRVYRSQFVDSEVPEGYRYTGLSDYLRNVRALNEALGAVSGVAAAEAFVSQRPVVFRAWPLG